MRLLFFVEVGLPAPPTELPAPPTEQAAFTFLTTNDSDWPPARLGFLDCSDAERDLLYAEACRPTYCTALVLEWFQGAKASDYLWLLLIRVAKALDLLHFILLFFHWKAASLSQKTIGAPLPLASRASSFALRKRRTNIIKTNSEDWNWISFSLCFRHLNRSSVSWVFVPRRGRIW